MNTSETLFTSGMTGDAEQAPVTATAEKEATGTNKIARSRDTIGDHTFDPTLGDGTAEWEQERNEGEVLQWQ